MLWSHSQIRSWLRETIISSTRPPSSAKVPKRNSVRALSKLRRKALTSMTDVPVDPTSLDLGLAILQQAHDDLDRIAARDAAAYLDLAANRAAAVLSALYLASPRYGIRPPFDIVSAMTGLTAWSMGIGTTPNVSLPSASAAAPSAPPSAPAPP